MADSLSNFSFLLGIHVPVRVEPKVYFATERTFLSWLEISVLLATISAVLLNRGQDEVAFWSAWAFTILACLSLTYSFMLYTWRVDKIRKRRDVKHVYYETWGPTIVCLGLLVSVIINFSMKFRNRS